MRAALITATLSLVVAVSLCGIRPLWLDEILQLLETRQPSVAGMMAGLPCNAGAAPLGYIVQQEALKVTGYSIRRARLPAALFAAAAVFVVACLGMGLGLQHSWAAAVIFAAFPLTLRYATESRVYSQALFFSALATLLYVHLTERPGRARAVVYCLALTAAAYTQPYSASVGFALVLWSVFCRNYKTAMFGGTSLAVTILAFLPWCLWSKDRWAASMVPNAIHFSVSIKTPLMLFRELTGAGYWGSGLVLVMCAVAIAGKDLARREQWLLVLLIAVPIVSVIASDAIAGYFLAARQFLWVLPALSILAAAGLQRYPRAGLVLLTLLGAVCIRQSIRFYTAPCENWQAAAAAIEERVAKGACLAVAPPEQARLYEFFQPALAGGRCGTVQMVLATTPYTTWEQQETAVAALRTHGYKLERAAATGGSRIFGFRRNPPFVRNRR
jgi:hypothetical protein